MRITEVAPIWRWTGKTLPPSVNYGLVFCVTSIPNATRDGQGLVGGAGQSTWVEAIAGVLKQEWRVEAGEIARRVLPGEVTTGKTRLTDKQLINGQGEEGNMPDLIAREHLVDEKFIKLVLHQLSWREVGVVGAKILPQILRCVDGEKAPSLFGVAQAMLGLLTIVNIGVMTPSRVADRRRWDDGAGGGTLQDTRLTRLARFNQDRANWLKAYGFDYSPRTVREDLHMILHNGGELSTSEIAAQARQIVGAVRERTGWRGGRVCR